MRKGALLLALAAAVVVAGYAQEGETQWYLGKPIRDFVFTGLGTVSAAELRPVVRPYVGKPFTIELYEEVREKLYALDYFELIEGTANPADEAKTTVIVELAVVERPTVASVEIRGNVGVRTPTIMDKILIKKGDMASEPLVDVDKETIRKLYLEKGYTKVEIAGKMEKNETRNTVSVVFDVTEGVQTKIRDILFSGNTFASESTLRRLMKTRKQSLLSSGDFQESVLEDDKQAILDYYGKSGFVDAKIVKVEQNVVDDAASGRSFRDITLYIEEGDQYTFGGISFEGNQLFDAAQLAEVVRITPGKPVNTEQLKAAIARVQDLYYRDGYLETGFTPQERRDTTTNEVSYILQIVESDRVHIESIILSGNEKTKDYVLLRELPFEEGDIYSTAKLRQGLINLSNLQYFSSVIPDYPQGSSRGLRDLVITVEEQSTAAFNFGFTVSGGQYPISGKVGWSEANFLGRGQTISVDAEVSNVRQSLSASFQEPYLLGLRWSGGLNLSVSHDQVTGVPQDVLGPVFTDLDYTNGIAVPDPYDGHYVYSTGDNAGSPYDFTQGGTATPPATLAELQAIVDANDLVTDYRYAGSEIPAAYAMSYDKLAFALGLRTGIRLPSPVGVFRIDPYLSSSIDYKSYDDSVYRPYRTEDRKGLRTWLLVNTVGVGLTWDKRDYYVNPQNGFFISESFSSVGGVLLGWKHYLKTTTTAAGYLTLLSTPVSDSYTFKIVLGVQTSLAFVLPQWHLDAAAGDGSWTGSSVTETSDLLYIDGMTNARGWRGVLPGKALWQSQIELRLPLAEQLLWWAFFFDAAGIWSEPAGIAGMGIEDFYFSFGAGLRFTHPQFPIRLYLSKGFRIDNGVKWKTGDLDLGAFSLDFVVSLGGLGF